MSGPSYPKYGKPAYSIAYFPLSLIRSQDDSLVPIRHNEITYIVSCCHDKNSVNYQAGGKQPHSVVMKIRDTSAVVPRDYCKTFRKGRCDKRSFETEHVL